MLCYLSSMSVVFIIWCIWIPFFLWHFSYMRIFMCFFIHLRICLFLNFIIFMCFLINFSYMRICMFLNFLFSCVSLFMCLCFFENGNISWQEPAASNIDGKSERRWKENNTLLFLVIIFPLYFNNTLICISRYSFSKN